jgi:hypothetical protein
MILWPKHGWKTLFPTGKFPKQPIALSNLKLGVKTPDFYKISDVSVQLKSQIQS